MPSLATTYFASTTTSTTTTTPDEFNYSAPKVKIPENHLINSILFDGLVDKLKVGLNKVADAAVKKIKAGLEAGVSIVAEKVVKKVESLSTTTIVLISVACVIVVVLFGIGVPALVRVLKSRRIQNDGDGISNITDSDLSGEGEDENEGNENNAEPNLNSKINNFSYFKNSFLNIFIYYLVTYTRQSNNDQPRASKLPPKVVDRKSKYLLLLSHLLLLSILRNL
jgi:hypothetical protein